MLEYWVKRIVSMVIRKRFDEALRIIDSVEKIVVITSFILMVAFIVIGVFTRYVLNFSISWGQDFALLCFIWVTLVGASVGAKRGQLIRVESFITFVPNRFVPYIQLFINFCIGVFLVFLLKSSMDLVIFNWHSLIPSMQISMSAISTSILVASLFMLLHYVIQTATAFLHLIRGKSC
jgi:TRAP-type C4-dicarboxylate transport system permease small subunit